MATDRRLTQPSNERSILVGRDREQTRLHVCLDRTLDGHGSLVLISGEAGIGKTTLVEYLLHEARGRDALVLSGGCYDLTTTPPYGPWVEILRVYPARCDLPPIPHVLRDRELEGITSQERLFTTIAAFLADVAAARPLVLVLEDLHWSDIASVDLLRYLSRHLSQRRAMIVATYRDDEVTRGHPLFSALPLVVRESRAERIDLRRFDEGALRALISERYTLPDAGESRLATFLLRHTEGNPLFVIEVLRSIEHERAIYEGDGGWTLGSLDDVAPPPLVVQMIERQLAMLDQPTRDALEAGALIGYEPPLDLWQRVAEVIDDALSEVITEALKTRVIELRGGNGLRFRHALIRDVLYRGILFPRRRRLHRLVAEALMELASSDPDSVAYHLQQAGDARAVEWLIRAGDHADFVGADVAAVERYEAALCLLGTDESASRERGWIYVALGQSARDIRPRQAFAYTEEARRVAERIGDTAMAAWALFFRGEQRFFIGQNGIPEIEQGVALLGRLQASDFPDLPSRFRRWSTHDMRPDIYIMQAIFGHFRQALADAEAYLAHDDPRSGVEWAMRGHAEAARAIALDALGHPEDATVAYRRLQEVYERLGFTWHRAHNATGHLQYGVLTYYADHPAERRRGAQEVESLWAEVTGVSTHFPPRFGLLPQLVVEGAWSEVRELALPFANRDLVFNYYALYTLGIVARWQGDRDLAWNMVATGLPDGPETEPGSVWMRCTTELQQLAADLAIDDGDAALAFRWIQSYDRWLDWSERVQGRAESQLLWTRYHVLLGDPETARGHAEQALEHAGDPRQPLALVAALRALGELDRDSGEHETARERLDHALELSEACAAPYEQALCLLALAELNAATGSPDNAWTQLDRARALCAPLEAAPALQRATAIASRLAVRRGKATHPAGMTPREVDVLVLVAEGLTDAEVAERLFVSPRTVNSHLNSIYNKLGVNSRVAATRFAVDQGLTDSIAG